MKEDILTESTTLSPLPPILRRGLTAVAFLGLLSFFTSVALFFRLAWRLINWRKKPHARFNQLIILIFNLVFADIQQSISFLLNAQWLRLDRIEVDTSICWAQAWFISTGDLASGVFTVVIAVHSFMDIILNYRLQHRGFLTVIFACWAFIYGCNVTGLALHPTDFYVRAGAWCAMSMKYTNERLWLHYIWIITAEFGTVVIYTLIFLILRRRVKESFYTTSDTALRAQSAARLIIAYPIVYVVCTLPIVIARLTSMAHGYVGFVELLVAGAMITSNGWLDVLLYSLTRRGLVFGPELPDSDTTALDTFRFHPDQSFGTTTTIQAVNLGRVGGKPRQHQIDRLGSPHGSTEELVGFPGVKAETVVQVTRDIIELDPMRARVGNGQLSKGRSHFESRSGKSDE